MKLFYLLITTFFIQTTFSQSYEFSGEIKGLKNCDVILAYYYGNKQFAKDTARVNKNGKFIFYDDKSLEYGMYMVVLPDGNYFEMVVMEDRFSFTTSVDNLIGDMKFTNSYENEKFYEYMQFLSEKQKALNELKAKKENVSEKEAKSIDIQIEELGKVLMDFQTNFTSNYPNILFSKILNASKDVEMPKFPLLADGTDDKDLQFKYYKSHFFDTFDFSDERLLRTPVFHSKINTYLENLTAKTPDSIIVSCDYLIEKSRANPEVFRYVISYLASTYERSKIEDAEKVFDHIVLKYYMYEEMDWLEKEQLNNIIREANTPKSFDENSVRIFLKNKKIDDVEGIYRFNSSINNITYKLLILKQKFCYEAYLMEGKCKDCDKWSIGELKATFCETNINGILDTEWILSDKSKKNEMFFEIENSIITNKSNINLVKLFPLNSANEESIQQSEWIGNGSGIIISKLGHIVTNFHVVDGINEIEVEFIHNREVQKLNAEVIQSDKVNDLAILKIKDSSFIDFKELNYNFKTRSSDVGTKVYAFGYPLALSVMGKEMKVTDGIISSKTGYDGNITTYQISAAIQGGNSGGPLFDDNGSLIGINSSGLSKEIADNVGYSIKTNYLLNLIDILPESIDLPSSNKLANLPLTEQIKEISKYVVLIKVK